MIIMPSPHYHYHHHPIHQFFLLSSDFSHVHWLLCAFFPFLFSCLACLPFLLFDTSDHLLLNSVPDPHRKLSQWTVENGGDGWGIVAVPPSEQEAAGSAFAHVTSFKWCWRSQIVDLLNGGDDGDGTSKGRRALAAELLNAQPTINISEVCIFIFAFCASSFPDPTSALCF